MTRKQLIEFGILAVAIIMLFKAIESIIEVIVVTIYGFTYSFEGNSIVYTSNFILLGVYLLIFFIFIKKRDFIADFINDRSPVQEPSEERRLLLNLDQQQLLYIIFIVIAIISLIASITGMIQYLVNYFSNEVSRGVKQAAYGDFKADFIKIIVASLLILFAKSLSEYFAKRNSKMPTLEFEKQGEE